MELSRQAQELLRYRKFLINNGFTVYQTTGDLGSKYLKYTNGNGFGHISVGLGGLHATSVPKKGPSHPCGDNFEITVNSFERRITIAEHGGYRDIDEYFSDSKNVWALPQTNVYTKDGVKKAIECLEKTHYFFISNTHALHVNDLYYLENRLYNATSQYDKKGTYNKYKAIFCLENGVLTAVQTSVDVKSEDGQFLLDIFKKRITGELKSIGSFETLEELKENVERETKNS